MPCAAASSSMPTMCAVLAIIGAAGARRRSPSTRGLPGWPRSAACRRWPDARATCSREASAPAVTWAIMKPEFRPGVAHQERRQAATRRRRSAARCGARPSRRSRRSPAPACRRRRPPARRGSCRRRSISPSPEHQRIVGDRIGLDQQHRAAWRIRSRQAPITCGWQRRQYGSCTRSSPSRCDCADRAAGEQRAVVAARRRSGPAGRAPRGCAGRTARRCPARRPATARRRPAPLRARARPEQAVQRQRGRDLRAVDQRQAFLGGQRQRRDAGVAQRFGRRHAACRRPRTSPRRSAPASCAPAAPGRPRRRPSPGRNAAA